MKWYATGRFRLAAMLLLMATMDIAGTAYAFNPETDEPAAAPSAAYNPEADSRQVATASQPVPNPQPQPQSDPVGDRGIVCDGQQVCREPATGLAFQVLPRSFANVYRNSRVDTDEITEANVPAFTPLYVFQTNHIDLSIPDAPKGWYHVARQEAGPTIGWMQASDVLEWRQALVVAYTHPGTPGEGRQRALMFERKQQVMDLLAADDLASRAVALYTDLEQGRIPAGVISKEPERFVDISRDFYLLPIVDYEQVDWNGDEVRVLQLASALPERRGADTLDDPNFLRAAMQKPSEVMDDTARELGIDLVFVMDMTRSMQPYIDRTRDAIADIAKRVVDSTVNEKVRFGLVGFRDDVRLTPALDFTSKDFTPELLDVSAFEALLQSEARAAEVSTVGFAEESFAGIDTALRANWRPGSLRIVVLVSDASSHPLEHAQNTTGKGEAMLQMEADDLQTHVIALHLHDGKHPDDHRLARQQYGVLASVRGNPDKSAMVSVNTEDTGGFQAAVEAIAGDITDTIAHAQAGTLDDRADQGGPAGDPSDVAADDPAGQARSAVRAVINAAMMEYLGRDVEAPKDIVAWTLDRDLTNPAVTSLDVRVLLNKRQLNDLILVIENIVGAMDASKMSNKQFFTALREVAGQAIKDPDALLQASNLSQSGLLPAYIGALPYQSEILYLNDAMFASMTAEQRARLESTLRAKLRAYRDIASDVDGWKSLHSGSAELDKVYPLRLDYLP